MNYLTIIEVDFSHGIIFGVDQDGQEIEARWTGIVDLNELDVILIDQNNHYVSHVNLGGKH